MARPIDLAKWHRCAERLRRLERSGTSVCAWCRQERVSQFYQWRRKLAAHGWLQGTRCGIGPQRKKRTILNGRGKSSTSPARPLGHGVHRHRTSAENARHTAARPTDRTETSDEAAGCSCLGERPPERGGLFVPVEFIGRSIIEVLVPGGVQVRVPASERRTLCALIRLLARIAPGLACQAGQRADDTLCLPDR